MCCFSCFFLFVPLVLFLSLSLSLPLSPSLSPFLSPSLVFDDGDERTLKRSSLCLKGARHYSASESLDQMPLTDPENFGTPAHYQVLILALLLLLINFFYYLHVQ